MTTEPTAYELLASDTFSIEKTMTFFGRPVALVVRGAWSDDGSASATLGMVAIDPPDFCRILAALRYQPGGPFLAARVTEEDDPRDDAGVLERHFRQPLQKMLDAAFRSIGMAFASAADLRDARAIEDLPIRETPAPAWVH